MTFHEELKALAQIVDSALTLFLQNTHPPERAQQPALTPEVWAEQRDQIINHLGQSSEVQHLQTCFGLENKRLTLLLLAVLPYWEPHYQDVYGQLQRQSEPAFPTLDHLLKLVTSSHEEVDQLSAELLQNGLLLRWRLLMFHGRGPTSLQRPLRPASDLLAFLKGAFRPEMDINECLHLVPAPQHPLVVEESLQKHFLASAPHQLPVAQSLIRFQGESGSGRRTLAHWFAQQRSEVVYELNVEKLWQFEDPYEVLRDGLRFLSLQRAMLYWPNALEDWEKRPAVVMILVSWLHQGPNRILLCGESYHPWPAPMAGLQPCTIELGVPSLSRSAGLWKEIALAYLDEAQMSVDWEEVSRRYRLLPHTIVQVCLQLNQRQKEGATLDTQTVLDRCLALSASSLANVAARVDPKYELHDLVLAEEAHAQVTELIEHYRHRDALQTARVFPTTGIMALFWGAPGTGKTMAAEAIAKRLTLPLYKADLSNISSKWIGETEKHLAALFDEAERGQAVLFFDEADAIFAKRTRVESIQDKNANMGVSFLLQRIEAFQGILILASNFKDNIDSAFFRRLHFSVEFQPPGPQERLALWQNCWPSGFRLSPTVDLKTLAELFVLTGSNIRNIAQAAMRLVLRQTQPGAIGEIQKSHLTQAIQNEYQKLNDRRTADYLLAQWNGVDGAGEVKKREFESIP